MKVTGSATAPQSLPYQNGDECAEWLHQLHHRVADRVPHAWVRDCLHRYCRTEAAISAGWPTFRLIGQLPDGYPGSAYTIQHQYRAALAAVLKELAAPGALEVRLPEPIGAMGALFGGMTK